MQRQTTQMDILANRDENAAFTIKMSTLQVKVAIT